MVTRPTRAPGWRAFRPFLAAGIVFLAACAADSTGPPAPDGVEVAVVLNSVERSLTVVPLDAPADAYTIGVSPEGSPAAFAARRSLAVVPLGTYPFAAVVDLRARTVAHTVALPAGSGASGAAFLNDSIALVGNPELNSVTPVNVRRGTAGTPIPVGDYPHRIIGHDGRAYVLNANLDEFWQPAGGGTISVIDGSLAIVDSIPLSGANPGAAVARSDGRLYVVNSGAWGTGSGSLSVVDIATGDEIGHHTGFGDFPGAIAARGGRLFVTVYGVGLLEWNPLASAFVRGPENPLAPGSIPPVAGIGTDSEGILYAVNPGDCVGPGRLLRLSPSAAEVTLDVPVGICPFDLAFTVIDEG